MSDFCPMTDSTSPKPESTRRSRQGCAECRRRHKRCDESKPDCGYCRNLGHSCNYSRQLSWGGRSFKKSRFGKCLEADTNIKKITSPCDPGSFVYGRRGQRKEKSAESQQQKANRSLDLPTTASKARAQLSSLIYQSQVPDTEDELGSAGLWNFQLSYSLNSFSWLPTGTRCLLDYFIHGMTRSISCHAGIQNGFHSTFVPMALESSHVLSAILFLAAIHRQSVGLDQNPTQIERLRSSSLVSLSIALNSLDHSEKEKAVATSLILCVAEIVSGGNTADALRIHLSGASVLLGRMEETGYLTETLSPNFLIRIYTSLRSIALCCGTTVSFEFKIPSKSIEETNYFDDLAGFSESLIPIFEAIDDLDTMEDPHESIICNELLSAPHFSCTSRLAHQSHILYDSVRSLMAKRKINFRPDLENCSPTMLHEFDLLDEAYHQMALLQIYRRGSLSIPHQAVQDSVSRIISSLSALVYRPEPCPSVAALAPLLVAGCNASRQDEREAVLELMRNQWACFGMGNVKSAQRLVSELWWDSDLRSRTGTNSNENSTSLDCLRDILPY